MLNALESTMNTCNMLVCSKDQLWTSCPVLKWHSSFNNSMCKDVTHWAIGLYSDHNKSYVVYLQRHFCSLRHPRLYMHSGIPLIQKPIFYKFWYFSTWAKYSEVWKSANNIFTWLLWHLLMPRLPFLQVLELWRAPTHSLLVLQLKVKEIIQMGILIWLIVQVVCRSSVKILPVRT